MTHAERCHWCGIRIFSPGSPEVRRDPNCKSTIDHIVPKTFGGRKLNNVVRACAGCNNVRGHAPAEVWESFMRVGRTMSPDVRHKRFREFCALLLIAGLRAARAKARRSPPPRVPVSSIADVLANVRRRAG
jgi:hypothetical protein